MVELNRNKLYKGIKNNENPCGKYEENISNRAIMTRKNK
jgi:hypothetical protein